MAVGRVQSYPIPANWQVQLGSLILGDQTPYQLEGVEGLDLPAVANSDSPRAGTHGAFGGLDLLSPRDLIFTIQVVPRGGDPPLSTLIDNLISAFSPSAVDEGLVFVLPPWGPRLALGRPRRCHVPFDAVVTTGVAARSCLAQFTALDPLLYSATLQDLTIPYPTPGIDAGIAFDNATAVGMTFAPNPRPVQNSGFEETAVTPWITTPSVSSWVAGATLTRDATQFHSGTVSGKVVTDGLAQNEGTYQVAAVPKYFVPGQTYVLSCWVFTNSAGAKLQVSVNDATNGLTTTSASVATPTGAWTQISVTFTIGPLAPATIQFGVRDNGTAVTRTFWVDDYQFTPGTVGQAYTRPATIMGVTFGAIGGSTSTPGQLILTNNGNAPSLPVSTFRGPATGALTLEKVETGEVITLNINLGSTDTLEVDHDMHTVILNGVTNRQDVVDPSTQWWSLPPGNSTIRYRTFGSSPGSSVEVKFRDAWW